jgi:hypothetical protein
MKVYKVRDATTKKYFQKGEHVSALSNTGVM